MSIPDYSPNPKFESQKEYLEYLQHMMVSSIEEEEETFGEARGRPRLLKTYLMEANRGLPENNEGFDLEISKADTGASPSKHLES